MLRFHDVDSSVCSHSLSSSQSLLASRTMLAMEGLAAGFAKLAASARAAHSYTNSFLSMSASSFMTPSRNKNGCAPRGYTRLWRLGRRRFVQGSRLQRELAFQLLRYRFQLQAGVLGNAVLVRWVIFALDQRCQIVAARLGDAKAVGGDEVARHLLLDIGDLGQRCLGNAPAVLLALAAHDGRHHGVLTCYCHFHGSAADGIGLLDIHRRGDMACRALQVVGHRPVILVA